MHSGAQSLIIIISPCRACSFLLKHISFSVPLWLHCTALRILFPTRQSQESVFLLLFKSLPLNNPHVAQQGPISISYSFPAHVPGKFVLDTAVDENTLLIKSDGHCKLRHCHTRCQADLLEFHSKTVWLCWVKVSQHGVQEMSVFQSFVKLL